MSEEELRFSEDALLERIRVLCDALLRPQFVWRMAKSMLGNQVHGKSARTRAVNAAYEIERIVQTYVGPDGPQILRHQEREKFDKEHKI